MIGCLMRRLSIADVDGSAAICCAAMARYALDVFVEMIVDCQLFAGMDVADAHI